MTAPDTPPSVSGDAAIAQALAPMQVIAEAVVGYHRKLLDGGINDESAGRMAEEYHKTLMAVASAGAMSNALKGITGKR